MINLKKKMNESYLGAQFHHNGIACENIEKTFSLLKIFLPKEIEYSDNIFDSKLNAELKLIKLNKECFIELVSGKVVEGFIKKKIFIYHNCFEVEKLSDFSENLLKLNFIPITKPTPADLLGGRLVQFFHTQFGVMEILEKD